MNRPIAAKEVINICNEINLTPELWEEATPIERISKLQDFEFLVAKNEGRAPARVGRDFFPNPEERARAIHIEEAQQTYIIVNTEALLNGSKEAFTENVSIFAHEQYHAYQRAACEGRIDHFDKEELKSWKENMAQGYIYPQARLQYYKIQPLEASANAHQNKIEWELVNEYSPELVLDAQHKSKLIAQGFLSHSNQRELGDISEPMSQEEAERLDQFLDAYPEHELDEWQRLSEERANQADIAQEEASERSLEVIQIQKPASSNLQVQKESSLELAVEVESSSPEHSSGEQTEESHPQKNYSREQPSHDEHER